MSETAHTPEEVLQGNIARDPRFGTETQSLSSTGLVESTDESAADKAVLSRRMLKDGSWETHSLPPQAPDQIAKHKAGRENDEVMREKRRDLAAKLEEATITLEQAGLGTQSAEKKAEVERFTRELKALDFQIQTAQDRVLEGARAEDEVDEAKKNLGQAESEFQDTQAKLEQIHKVRKEYKAKLEKARRKLLPKQSLTGWLRNQVGKTDVALNASAQRLVEEQEVAKLRQDHTDLDEEGAKALYTEYLKSGSEVLEKQYKQEVEDTVKKIEGAQDVLSEREDRLEEVNSRLSESRAQLAELVAKQRRLQSERMAAGSSAHSAEIQESAELEVAKQKVSEIEQSLTAVNEEEKQYWQGLMAEFAADVASTNQEVAEAVSEKTKKAKREKVRGLFSDPEQFLHIVNEIGREGEGKESTISVDTSIQDLAAVTLQLVDRYQLLENVAKRYGNVNVVERDKKGAAGEKQLLMAYTEAMLEVERRDAVQEMQQQEYAKWGAFTDSQLEEKIAEGDKDFLDDKDVQELRTKLVDAKNWLELPSHRNEGFKKTHKKKIKEYEATVKTLERDFKLAERDIQVQKDALTRENMRRKAKADNLLAEWKTNVLAKHIKTRRAQELQADSEYLESLFEGLTPAERELVISGELNKAMIEADAVFENLIKWGSVLENPDSTAEKLAQAEVAQDLLIRQAGDVVGRVAAELALAQNELSITKDETEKKAVQVRVRNLKKSLEDAQQRLTLVTSEKETAMKKTREAYLPAELASQDIAQSQELQFGHKRAVSDIRRLYTGVMYGRDDAHTFDEGIAVAKITERVGVLEQWVSEGGQSTLEGLVSEKVAKAKEASARGESKETEGGLSVEQALEKGAEAIRKAVAENPNDLAELVGKEGGADRFVRSGGLQALIEGVARLGGDKAGMIKNLEAQNLVMRALPNGETIYAPAIAANTSILGLLL